MCHSIKCNNVLKCGVWLNVVGWCDVEYSDVPGYEAICVILVFCGTVRIVIERDSRKERSVSMLLKNVTVAMMIAAGMVGRL